MSEPTVTPVILVGAAGRMGQEAIRALAAAPGVRLSAAVTRQRGAGQDAGQLVGLPPLGVNLTTDLAPLLAAAAPGSVLVDLSSGESAAEHAQLALAAGLPVVIGATGLSPQARSLLQEQALVTGCGVLLAPNFSLGALLLMRFAQQARAYFDWVEILELHHEQKKDAPSGTALRTAELLHAVKAQTCSEPPHPARGQQVYGIPVHSVRLPGLLAHQEVIFGAEGQTLSLRHDSSHRSSFMPGLLLAIEKVQGLKALVYGLEQLL